MDISHRQSGQLKAIAILMMLYLHLFNTLNYESLFTPLIFIGEKPFVYYISLFCDACVPIFAFVSGYGLYFKYTKKPQTYKFENFQRIKKIFINYWIILLLFAVLLGMLLQQEGYPGSFRKFLLNFSAVDTSYNGAWWFFTIYILFVLSSHFWFTILDKINVLLFLGLLVMMYLIAFYFRIYRVEIFDYEWLALLYRQSVLYFCTLLQFMLGAFALKYHWKKAITRIFNSLKYRTVTALFGIVLLIVFHGIVPNFIIAPFTGLCFVFLFLEISTGDMISKVLDFFAPHSTNIWLIHMFFYLIYFKDFVYGFRYVSLIFLVLVSMCLVGSYLINFINHKIQQLK